MSMRSIIEINDGYTFHFHHQNFSLVYHYNDGLLNDYDKDIETCRQVVCHTMSNTIETDPNWIFILNETDVEDDYVAGLICRKMGNEIIQFGYSENQLGCFSYIQIPLDDIEARVRISSFYNKIMDMLIYRRDNSLKTSIKQQWDSWFK